MKYGTGSRPNKMQIKKKSLSWSMNRESERNLMWFHVCNCRISARSVGGSVTRWTDYFLIYVNYQQWKVAQKNKQFTKNLIKTLQICQSGTISPILVTLGHSRFDSRRKAEKKATLIGTRRTHNVEKCLAEVPECT